MPNYVFYTEEIGLNWLAERRLPPYTSAGASALQNWKEKNSEQCMYVMKNAKNIQVATQQDYVKFGVTVRVTAELSEQDYILYRLKY
jgi:hypothetical protein